MDRRVALLVFLIVLLSLVGALLLRGGDLGAPDRVDAGRSGSIDVSLDESELVAVGAQEPALASSESAKERTEATVDPESAVRTLVVLLRTVQGRPVDDQYVRVRLRDRSTRDVESLILRSDVQGRAKFSAEDIRRVQAQAPMSPMIVEFASKTHSPVFEELAPDVIPEEPIALEVDMMRVVAWAVTPGGETWTGRHGLTIDPDEYHYTSTAGPAPRVSWIPRGVGYELRVYGCGLFEDGEERFPAPSPEEIEREHRIVLGPPSPGISGRFVDWEGEPIPRDTYVQVMDEGRRGSDGARWAKVHDDDGRFEYPLKLDEEPGRIYSFRFKRWRAEELPELLGRALFEVAEPGA
ncbi:MAG: hypothetical protein AAGB93_18835, partial [Planctomycetota bacterium]